MLSQVSSLDLMDTRSKSLLSGSPFMGEDYAHKLTFDSHFVFMLCLTVTILKHCKKLPQKQHFNNILALCLFLPGQDIFVYNFQPSFLEIYPFILLRDMHLTPLLFRFIAFLHVDLQVLRVVFGQRRLFEINKGAIILISICSHNLVFRNVID